MGDLVHTKEDEERLQAYYAQRLEEENLEADLEELEAKYEAAVKTYRGLDAVGAFDTTPQVRQDTIDYLSASKTQLDHVRLVIEQIKRASQGKAYGPNLRNSTTKP